MRNKFSAVSDPNVFHTESGDPVHVLYSPRISKNGSVELVQSGKENIPDKIASFRSQTDFAYILKRLQLGDTSVLNVGSPMYGDFTNVPKSMAEAMQIQIDAEKTFLNLPLDVRNSFDHDFRKWLVSAGSPDWLAKMRPVLPDEMRSINNKDVDPSAAADQSDPGSPPPAE